MKRREFITLLGSAAVAWPLAARAQSNPVRRIGVLMDLAADDPEGRARLAAFRAELIPVPVNQNSCAHWRRPMDMILQGWSTSLFHASQQWSTRSS